MITAKLSNEELSALRTVWYNVGVVGETPEREALVKHGYLIRTHKQPAMYEMSKDGALHFRMLEVNHIEKLESEIAQLRKQFTAVEGIIGTLMEARENCQYRGGQDDAIKLIDTAISELRKFNEVE